MLNFLKTLHENKTIIIGGLTVLSESIIILINLYRRIAAIHKTKYNTKLMISNIENSQSSKMKIFLWAANPLNLFRKPHL